MELEGLTGRFIVREGQKITEKTYSGGIGANAMHADGRPVHTFRTASLYVFGNHSTFMDCTFENTAGPGKQAGQAIALYVDADDVRLEGCTIRGYQDTLFLAPLPDREREKDGFLGPCEKTPRTPRTVYFRNCLIEGGVDFIFGGATAFFDDCEFRSVEPGYVFAPCTPKDVKEGFVARNCRFTAAKDVPDGSCFIGRPWRNHAMVRLENCELGAHIHREGWHIWTSEEPLDTVRFYENGSYGPGASAKDRPSWVHVEEKR